MEVQQDQKAKPTPPPNIPPNKEPTTQLVLSNYKIISAHNMQEKKIAMEKCIQIHFIVQQHAMKVAAHSRSCCICICILGKDDCNFCKKTDCSETAHN